MAENQEKESVLTKKDIRKAYNGWHQWAEVGHSYERMQGIGMCRSQLHILEKLYKDNPEGLKKALKRQSELFNTEGCIGATVVGATVSMEETMVELPEEEKNSIITSLKVGLMGPFAGLGDSLNWTVLKPIFLGIGCDLAIKGNPLGAVIAIIFAVLMYLEGRYLYQMGYRMGKSAFTAILGGNLISKLTTISSILGMFMMGALGASYVSLATPIEIVIGNNDAIVLQEALDSIVGGILPLGALFLIYFIMKKTNRYGLICLSVMAVSVVGSFFGIF
ncbi:PTS system mannose/fructose/sorbose family transporter subunit IID [Clostridium sp. AF19-22AC]|jgi:D-glucosaminate-specific PTS system IID component|uniref:PTS system mannose/fructose/sorbose family transporter subunit IID n=1 Tax=Clostridia TaxID=186801 RepID=UPI000E508707|nr:MULTISPECIES: PTS system mannose/fructose/sorbose family transporter subunit IID [Clostridia]RHR27529.1 PTS system mannose/fructose/sorbose family transporter subunit IID [Clostridium sp. AF19-22AC]